jgi:hypothetical protein
VESVPCKALHVFWPFPVSFQVLCRKERLRRKTKPYAACKTETCKSNKVQAKPDTLSSYRSPTAPVVCTVRLPTDQSCPSFSLNRLIDEVFVFQFRLPQPSLAMTPRNATTTRAQFSNPHPALHSLMPKTAEAKYSLEKN